jgi:hypothetical protein
MNDFVCSVPINTIEVLRQRVDTAASGKSGRIVVVIIIIIIMYLRVINHTILHTVYKYRKKATIK